MTKFQYLFHKNFIKVIYLTSMKNFFPTLAELVIERRLYFIFFGLIIAFGLMAGAPNINISKNIHLFSLIKITQIELPLIILNQNTPKMII